MAEADTALDVPDKASFGVNFMPTPAPTTVPDQTASPPDDFEAMVTKGKQVQGDLADIKRQEIAQQSFVDRQETSRAQMHRAYQAEGEAKNALPPKWDSDKERKERLSGPIEQFGSVGMVFAMMASAFTKTPMTSALNAGAAAMRSIQDHDREGYDSAYKAWLDNTNLAIKRFDMERAGFDDANKMLTSDLNAWRTKTAANAARFGDQKTLMLLENGMDPQVLDIQGKQVDSMNKLLAAKKGFVEFDRDNRLFQQGKEAFKAQHPNATPQQDVQNSLELLHSIKSAEKGLNYTSLSPERQYVNQRVSELMKPPEEGGKGLSATEAIQQAEKEFKDSTRSYLETDQRLQARRKTELSAQLQKPTEEGGEGLNKIEADRRANESINRENVGSRNKIDQAIVNQIPHYPGLKTGDLGYIPPARQVKLASAFESAVNLENIAQYVKDHPKSIGLVADVARKMNLDAYQGMVQKADKSGSKSDLAAVKSATEADFEKTADKTLTLSQAAEAKVLNKLLATQSFADAAAAGSRGATIYLDKAFREIYQQASSPAAFFSILEQRYKEADRVAGEYKMHFSDRDDQDKMPFYVGGAKAYAGTVAPVAIGKDGRKFRFLGTDINDPKQRRVPTNWELVQ